MEKNKLILISAVVVISYIAIITTYLLSTSLNCEVERNECPICATEEELQNSTHAKNALKVELSPTSTSSSSLSLTSSSTHSMTASTTATTSATPKPSTSAPSPCICVEKECPPQKTIIPNENEYKFTIVTPTVRRAGADYIQVLAASLWSSTPPERRKNINKWIILNGNHQIEVNSGLDCVRRTYSDVLHNNWWIIEQSRDYTDDVELALNKTQSSNDSEERKRWRIAESLHFIESLEHAINFPTTTHIVILQDDVVLAYDWLGEIIRYFNSKQTDALFMMKIGGYLPYAVGAIYTRATAVKLYEGLKKDYWSAPVDLSIGRIMSDHSNHFKQTIANPSLIQHVGISSSLPGKKQILTTGNFAWGSVGPGITTPAAAT